jgi:hypothetical protein
VPDEEEEQDDDEERNAVKENAYKKWKLWQKQFPDRTYKLKGVLGYGRYSTVKVGHACVISPAFILKCHSDVSPPLLPLICSPPYIIFRDLCVCVCVCVFDWSVRDAGGETPSHSDAGRRESDQKAPAARHRR